MFSGFCRFWIFKGWRCQSPSGTAVFWWRCVLKWILNYATFKGHLCVVQAQSSKERGRPGTKGSQCDMNLHVAAWTQQLHCLGKKVGAALLNLETSSAFLIEVSVSLFTAVAAPALEHSKRMAQWTSDSMVQEAVFVLTELRKVFIVSAWA